MVKFSVIVPIYKVERYIIQSIESVLNQSYDNFELILVDDGSPDKCPQICDEYAKKDERIKVIHKKNEGLPAARNSGIRVAEGDYLMHLDGDDFWDINYLKNVVPIIENDYKDIYLGNSRFDYINGETKEEILYDIHLLKGASKNDIIKYFMTGINKMPSAAWHNIFRTSFIKDNNLYLDESLTWSEDADNFFNTLVHANTIEFFAYTFYYYRRDNIGAMTRNPSAKHFLSGMKVSKKWFDYFKNSNFPDDVKELAMQRFSNGYMYTLKSINCLNDEEYKKIEQFLDDNEYMLKYIQGFPCKYIYLISKIIGYRNTSRLLNLIGGK